MAWLHDRSLHDRSHVIAPTLYAKLPFDAGQGFHRHRHAVVSAQHADDAARPTAKTISELIALTGAEPGKYSFASSGAGTSPQISGEFFKQLACAFFMCPTRAARPPTRTFWRARST